MTADDLLYHTALGITEELLTQAGVRRVTNEEARDVLGSTHRGDLAGIEYPYRHPTTGQRVTSRVRRDHPEMENGTPKDKYLSAYGDRRHFFFSPGVSHWLADPTVPVIVVEAEKSALSISSGATQRDRALVTIATGGCWGWRGRIGKTVDPAGQRVDETGPLPDFDLLTWVDRACVICFDSNVATNSRVQAARRQLTQVLIERGARVSHIDLPQDDGVNGPDDYVGRHGHDAFFQLLDTARPARRSHDQPVEELVAAFGLAADRVPDYSTTELTTRLTDIHASCAGSTPGYRVSLMHELKTKSKVPTPLVNAAFAERDAPTTADADIILPDDEPWPEPVDGATLLDETAAYLRTHLVLTDEGITAITLWIAAAHAVDAFDLLPFLLLSSPVPECGKSTTLFAVECLVPRPINVSNVTGAPLFRVITKYHPTLLMDEADTWLLEEKSDLRGIVNAGHSRQGMVMRCVGDDNDVKLFTVFGPKVIAQIGTPAKTILSRSIVVPLRRKRASESVTHLRQQDGRRVMAPLRRKWRRWADDHLAAIREYTPDLPAALINRARDNWEPLLSIAQLVGDRRWRDVATATALAVSGFSVDDDQPVNIRLLADVQRVFTEREEPHLSSTDLVEALKSLPESEWAGWNKGNGLTDSQLAKQLRGFGGRLRRGTRDTRHAGKVTKRWHRADFIEAWADYLPSEPQHPQQTNETGPQPPIREPLHDAGVAAPEMPVSSMKPGLVAGVAGVAAENRPGHTVSVVGDDFWEA